MNRLARSLALTTFAALASARAARAADSPLLVVVESAPGLDVGAAEVRHAVATELRTQVLGPHDPPAPEAAGILIVALDRSEIRMSFRTAGAEPLSRAIPSPADRPARLRAIGWLAGNLARDQVTGIVTPIPSASSPPNAAVSDGVPEVGPRTQPAPETPTSPSPLPGPTAVATSAASPTTIPAGSEASVTSKPAAPAAAGTPRWSFTAVGGPLALTNDIWMIYARIGRNDQGTDFGYQLEVQRQVGPNGLVLGAALDTGGYQLLGLAGFAGSTWRLRHWFVEGTAGAGIEAVKLSGASTVVTSSSSGGLTVTQAVQTRPALYARATGTFGVPVTGHLDLVARVGLDLGSAGYPSDFVLATIGVRFTLL